MWVGSRSILQRYRPPGCIFPGGLFELSANTAMAGLVPAICFAVLRLYLKKTLACDVDM